MLESSREGKVMTENFRRHMTQQAEELGIVLNEVQLKQLFTYYRFLIEQNEVMNLTAITEENEVISKHFTDSMALALLYPQLKEGAAMRLIDVGTGAGFPGMVLKIIFPKLELVLSDALMKRIKFLKALAEQLELYDGIAFLHGRAEDLGRQSEWRDNFDLAVSRAVAKLSVLAEYDLPFVKPGGCFVAYKAGEVEAEVKEAEGAFRKLNAEYIRTIHYQLPETDISRTLIQVKKQGKTPKAYPRKAGTPGRQPLC